MRDILISDLRALTDFLYLNFKIDFRDYAISSFKRRIHRFLDLYKFDTVYSLITHLESEKSFLDVFVSEITVNVTELFRDPSFWRELRNDILPKIFENKLRVNIWHAGCSSGEEVFSMAILLYEMGLLDRVRLYASDLDSQILNRAKSGGGFSQKNMELNERNYIRFQGENTLEKYYEFRKSRYYISDEILKNINFSKYDLVQDNQHQKFDFILCRNVMIYFNQTLQNKVLSKLNQSLYKFGYLGVGSKESLIWCDVANKFNTVNNEEKIYKKIKD